MQLRIVNYLLNFILSFKIYAPYSANNNLENFLQRMPEQQKSGNYKKRKVKKSQKSLIFKVNHMVISLNRSKSDSEVTV